MAVLSSRRLLVTQFGSALIAVLVAEAIGRAGGLWTLVGCLIGWLIGGLLLFAPNIVSPGEGKSPTRAVAIAIVVGLMAGGVAGGVTYLLRDF